MRNQLLRDADWAGMAHSLEVRVPFVDIDLLRSAGPWIANGAPPRKLDLASMAHPPLPPSVVSRPKTGFTVPIREWLLAGVTPGVRPSNRNRGLRSWATVVHDQFSAQP